MYSITAVLIICFLKIERQTIKKKNKDISEERN